MTRRFAVLLSLAAVLAIPSFAHAATVTLTDYSGVNPDFFVNADGGGGAFTATTGPGVPLDNVSFITFCLEFTEQFSYNTPYDYTLSTLGAFNGGAGGGTPDPLSDATKWLYYKVVTGGYSSLSNAAAFGAPGNVGVRVQEAIWFLEQERDASQLSDPLSDDLAEHAKAAAILEWDDIADLGFTVYAMNLTLGTTNVQSQLAMTSNPDTRNFDAPEPASLFLLGSGLLFTSRRLIRRKTRS